MFKNVGSLFLLLQNKEQKYVFLFLFFYIFGLLSSHFKMVFFPFQIRNLVSLLRAMPNLTHLMGLFSEIDITTPPGIQLFQSLDELPSVVYADARIGEQPHIIVQLTRYRSDSDYYKIIPPSSSVNTSLDYRTWSGFRPCYRTFSLLGVRGSLDETRALI